MKGPISICKDSGLLSPKAAAEDYMNGTGLSLQKYPAGIRRLVQIAESPEATAAEKAIKQLRDISQMDRADPAENYEVQIVPICNQGGKIVSLGA